LNEYTPLNFKKLQAKNLFEATKEAIINNLEMNNEKLYHLLEIILKDYLIKFAMNDSDAKFL